MVTVELFKEVVKDKVPHYSVETLSEKSNLADEGLDSMDQVELVLGLEERFEISLNNVDMKTLKTVKDIIDTCNTLIAAKQ